MNKLLVSIVLSAIAMPLCAQDFEFPLEGISKVVISAETRIDIRSHSGKTLLIREKENYREGRPKKSKGLREISNQEIANTNYGVKVEKEGALLVVKGVRDRSYAGLVVRLPATMNVSAESLDNGGIYITGLHSEIEAINHHGRIKLTDVTGPIVVENDHGDVTIVFSTLNQFFPMSIVASNGDIDVTLPADSDATIRVKPIRGKFYTDLDLVLEPPSTNRKDKRLIRGQLNKGGPELNLQNFMGNIYLRKLQ
ncbi:MAG: DUF4097 family beta strand repeat-containing protein [Bacteroidota bacterium]